jgi:glycosyltransferase involved in cell wall biosynthesis
MEFPSSSGPGRVLSCDGAPGVSVVIPAYNYARYLPAAIDSILQQDYPAYEIIVVDDGSTDNTADVVARYGEKVRYIYQKNAGLPAARNTGIKAARHDFVSFLDADDLWLPTFLSNAMTIFVKLPQEYAIVACHYGFIDLNGQRIVVKSMVPTEPREISCRDAILQTRFGTSAVVARKSAFDEAGLFDETLRSSEDRDMWNRITARRRVLLTGERLVMLRRHSGNMSKNADRMRENGRRVIQKAYDGQLVPQSDRLFWLRVRSYHHFQNSWRYRDQLCYREAFRQLITSFVLWPWFPKSRELNEPFLFRARGFVSFMAEVLRLKKR